MAEQQQRPARISAKAWASDARILDSLLSPRTPGSIKDALGSAAKKQKQQESEEGAE